MQSWLPKWMVRVQNRFTVQLLEREVRADFSLPPIPQPLLRKHLALFGISVYQHYFIHVILF